MAVEAANEAAALEPAAVEPARPIESPAPVEVTAAPEPVLLASTSVWTSARLRRARKSAAELHEATDGPDRDLTESRESALASVDHA